MTRSRVIALGDLGHTTKLLANNFIPLNIGFIAAYLMEQFGKDVEVHLFKDPDRMLSFIERSTPDLVATSNYAWNRGMGLHVLKHYKEVRPDGAAVLGGPNFPKAHDKMHEWLRRYPFVDFAVENEGENSMASLVRRLLETGFRTETTRQLPMNGVFTLDAGGGLCHAPIDMLRDLDDIPSPYLEGVLDDFLLEDVCGTTLIPMIEGSRGCPFACTFCRAGIETNKIRRFGTDRVIAEIDYIGQLFQRHGRDVSSMLITDQNFGSLRRDVEIAEALRVSQERTRFPLSVMATSGKTNVNVVLDTMSRYDGIAMTMSVQSMDEKVLANIKRKNFPVEKYKIYQKQLKAQGKLSKSDIIVGLPGETHDSHLNSLRGLLKIGIDVIDPFTFMMLLGTEAEMPQSRKQYGNETMWRLLPGGFSDFGGTKVFESEEVSVATNTMTYEEYVHLRRIHLLVVTVCNGTLFREIKKLILERGLDIVDFLLDLEDYLSDPELCVEAGPESPWGVLAAFTQKTRGELFPSKEALEAFYATPRNYADLEHDRVGENLLQKHRYAMFRARPALADVVLKRLSRHLAENGCLRPEDEDLFALVRTRSEAMECLLAENPVTEADPLLFKVDHDVLAWREAEEGSLASFRLPEAQEIAVYYPPEVIERFERSIADGGTQDFAKARTIYRLGIEALLPVQAPTRLAADAQMAHARTNGNFAYAPKFLAPGD